MLYCRGCCPVAAVGRWRPPFLIDATIPIVEELSPPVPFPHPSSPTAATHRTKRCSLRAYAAQRSIRQGGSRARWLPMPTMMLVLTSPEIIANLRYKSYVFLRRKNSQHTTINKDDPDGPHPDDNIIASYGDPHVRC
jgi:hypothetical protein